MKTFQRDLTLLFITLCLFGCQKQLDQHPHPTFQSQGSELRNSIEAGADSETPSLNAVDCGQLRTQSPGGWGANPRGENPGVYLHANFKAAFGEFITVGCYPDNNYIKMTSAQAITNLLPTGGSADALTSVTTDPASLSNSMAGHIISLTLSVGFDSYDANFGVAGVSLGNMVIGSGAFQSRTVNDFLFEANKILGGCSSAFSYEEVLNTASAINENYLSGKRDNNFLICPVITPR